MYPRKLTMRKGNSPNSKNGWYRGVSVPGALNWTICRLLSQLCSSNFPTFALLYWRPILITQERGTLKMGKGNSPKMDEIQGFLYLRHSNWTICSLLSQFCSPNFTTFSLSCWESNSYYPREREAENGKMEVSQPEPGRGL